MRVVFLGTGGAGSPPGRAENSILVDSGDTRLLLDCGPGCGQRLYEAGYSVRDIDYVYVSHLHLDHWSGLFELTVYAASESTEPPVIVVPEPIADSAGRVILGLLPRSIQPRARLTEAKPGSRTGLGSLSILVAESSHSIPCYGVLLDDGESRLLYTSDTRLTRPYLDLAKEADLVVTEATMPTGMEDAAEKTGHQTISQALSYREYMRSGSILALVHITLRSEEEARRTSKRGVLVPSDLTALSI